MKITAIYGSERKGSTYNIFQILIEKLGVSSKDCQEFFLPKDMPHYCVGCTACFMVDEGRCPHHDQITPILRAMLNADLIILSSPVYVYHVTGQMKAFLDHFGFQWMVHRPNPRMFQKTAIAISTAAGGGMKSANKDMTTSLKFWGVRHIFSYGKAVRATGWKDVSPKIKQQIEKDITKLSKNIKEKSGSLSPRMQTKFLFYVMRIVQRKFMKNPADLAHWEKHGWFGKARPWKNIEK